MTAALHPCGGNPLPVGARVVEWGREGLDGRPRPVPCAHLWGNAITPHRATTRVALVPKTIYEWISYP